VRRKELRIHAISSGQIPIMQEVVVTRLQQARMNLLRIEIKNG
jgi:hypothetical protein